MKGQDINGQGVRVLNHPSLPTSFLGEYVEIFFFFFILYPFSAKPYIIIKFRKVPILSAVAETFFFFLSFCKKTDSFPRTMEISQKVSKM